MSYICNICSTKFDTKQHLQQHENKKNKCNVQTDYKCNKCNKFFKQQKTLFNHNIKCNNKEKKDKDKNDETTSIIVKSNSPIEKKVEILNLLLDIDAEQILNILKLNVPLDEQIRILNKINNNKNTKSNVNNTITKNSNNNSNNNTTNNIQINNFGKEDLSFMDSTYFTNLIMNQHIEKGYMQLIHDIYLNKEHPENNTIKVENINNKFAHVYNNGKWEAILKYDLKEKIHKKNYTILKMHYDKLKNTMSYPKKEETRTFLARDDTSDPHMMYVIDKIVLLFYNDAETVV